MSVEIVLCSDLDNMRKTKMTTYNICVYFRFSGGPVGGAAVSRPKGDGFNSYLTGFAGPASKPMEDLNRLWGFEEGFVLP